jgi:hypothetical protein
MAASPSLGPACTTSGQAVRFGSVRRRPDADAERQASTLGREEFDVVVLGQE